MKCPQCRTDHPDGINFCGKCGTSLKPESEEAKSYTKTMITRKELIIGSTFAERYQIIEDLGKGGMGRVYKALDSKIEERVALKVLNPEIATDEKTIARFRNELKLTRKISHRNICRLFDLGEAEGMTFISMEYVSGEDLKSLMRRIGQLTAGKAVFVVRQICQGLAEAHRQGVIHRDLKPQNIMIDKEGNARIMDFGIARSLKARGITEAGVIMGTPEYMSPEQVEGRNLDQRSDIYSLGVIFYEMLTGQTPFTGDTPLTVAVKQKTEIPVDPRKLNAQIPENLSRIIMRCLQKDKERRFQRTEDLLAELQQVGKDLPSTDRVLPERRTRSGEITVKFNLRRLALPMLLAVAVVVLGYLGLRLITNRGEVLLASGKPTLAIMHFENNTGDANLDHWRKALSDLLIADLSQSRLLEVLSAEDLNDTLEALDLLPAQSYSTRNLRDVAERAGVQFVLVGKMTQAGETIRLNTTLQDIREGRVIGSEQVEGQGEDSLFELVDGLTTHIKEDFQLSAQDIANDIDADVKNITTSSTEALNYYKEGLKYHHRAEYSKSIPLMELAIAIDPEFAMAYRNLSVAYSNLGLTSEARRHLQKAFELSDRVSERERYYILGDYFRGSESTQEKAIEAYTQLLEIYPDDTIGNNNLGILFLGLEQWDKAAERFETNLRQAAPNYFSYVNLANLYAIQEKYEKARKILQNYLERVEDHPRIRASLSQIYLLEGKYDEAMREAEAAHALDSEFFQYHQLKGMVHFANGEPQIAEEEFKKLMESDQPSAHQQAYRMLSSLYMAQGRLEEARGQLDQGIELADMVGEKAWEHQFHIDMAYAHMVSGDSEAALKECEAAGAIAQETGSLSLRKGSLLCRGTILLQSNSVSEAVPVIEMLQGMLEKTLNPKEMRYFHFLQGRLLMESDRLQDAVSEFDTALSLTASKDALRPLLQDARADAIYRSGDLDAALAAFQEITEPPVTEIERAYSAVRGFYMLGRIYRDMGRPKDARRNFEHFLLLWEGGDAELPELVDARKQLTEL